MCSWEERVELFCCEWLTVLCVVLCDRQDTLSRIACDVSLINCRLHDDSQAEEDLVPGVWRELFAVGCFQTHEPVIDHVLVDRGEKVALELGHDVIGQSSLVVEVDVFHVFGCAQ